MERIGKQDELKLDMLDSLARSQRALARILESIADVAGASEETARAIQENVELITKYQRILMVKMVDLAPREVRHTETSLPWTNARQKVTPGNAKKPGSPSHKFSRKPTQP